MQLSLKLHKERGDRYLDTGRLLLGLDVQTVTLPQRRGVDLAALRALHARRTGPQGVASVLARKVDPARAEVAVIDLAVVAHGLDHVLRNRVAEAQALLAE